MVTVSLITRSNIANPDPLLVPPHLPALPGPGTCPLFPRLPQGGPFQPWHQLWQACSTGNALQLQTTTGLWRTQRLASTMVRRRTVMGVWWLGSTGSSSLMAEHRLLGKHDKLFELNHCYYLNSMFRYRAADVTYEGEARPYVTPPKPAYSAASI